MTARKSPRSTRRPRTSDGSPPTLRSAMVATVVAAYRVAPVEVVEAAAFVAQRRRARRAAQ